MGTILIINALPVLRAGLRHVLHEAGLPLTVHEADSTHDAQEFIGPGLALVIMDPAESGVHPAAFVQQLRKAASDVPILFFGDRNISLFTSLAVRLGVNGYLCTLSNEKTIAATIHMMLGGMRCFPSQAGTEQLTGKMQTLSKRELSVLLLLRQGMRNIDIARKLYLSEKTISAHKRSILLKLDVNAISQISEAELSMGCCNHDSEPMLGFSLTPTSMGSPVMAN